MSENDSANILPPPAICPPPMLLPHPTVTTRTRRFNRSLTEVRPDAYIFDDGQHLEVRTVLEENELMQSSEEINEYSVSVRSRKLSVQSEEPEYCISPPPTTTVTQQQSVLSAQQSADVEQPIMRSDSITRRSLSIRQDTAKSEESKDTLTPLDGCEERTLVGVENSMPSSISAAVPPTADDSDRQRFGLRRRNSQLGRRNSESQSQQIYDINRSQNSLNIVGMPKRQFSLTQSEPDTDDGVGGVGGTGRAKPATKAGRHLLLQIHAEYTSITDELESMITSPTSSLMDEKPKKMDQLTNPEFAALIQKQHLKECEDNDYMVMEELMATRSGSSDECDDYIDGKIFLNKNFLPLQKI
jgi:transient receptor potential cation channel subfamily M protein 3